VAVGASGAAVAANTAAVPKKVTIKQKGGLEMKPNRFIKDLLRWDKDVYQVKSGGTIHVVTSVASDGPHTFTVVKKKDLPKNAAQMEKCKICATLGQAHGFEQNSDAPPKFQFLEDGVGQATAPNVDKPGDSGLTGQGKRGESIDFTVTAKKGSQLYFMCLIHPWMQGKVVVG
jgi:plastocyanin